MGLTGLEKERHSSGSGSSGGKADRRGEDEDEDEDEGHGGDGDTTQALVFSLLALAPFYMAQAIPLCSGIVSTIVSAVLMDNYAIHHFDKVRECVCGLGM